MKSTKKVKFSAAEKIFMRAMGEGMKLGEAAYKKGEPLSSCPFGPGLKNPDDAQDPRHIGWLYGWHECVMRKREGKAFRRGFNSVARAREGLQPRLNGDRDRDHYARGQRAGLAAQRAI